MKDHTLQIIRNLELPARFEQKIIMDIEYLFSCSIPTLDSIILFGSCARNQIRVTSDVDLLIITTDPLDRLLRGEIASVLEEEMDGVHTDGIFYTKTQYDNSIRLFSQQVKNEGIVIYCATQNA